jgi:hypothetical protein
MIFISPMTFNPNWKSLVPTLIKEIKVRENAIVKLENNLASYDDIRVKLKYNWFCLDDNELERALEYTDVLGTLDFMFKEKQKFEYELQDLRRKARIEIRTGLIAYKNVIKKIDERKQEESEEKLDSEISCEEPVRKRKRKE